MKLVILSSSEDQPLEVQEVMKMFDLGLDYFHIRKPKKGQKQLAEYIEQFPVKYRNRLILHSYHSLCFTYKLGGIHLSRKHRRRSKFYHLKLLIKRSIGRKIIVTRTFHKLTDLTNDRRKYSYTFLSPLFDSISQSTLSGGFSKRALLLMIPQAKQPVLAMGGITISRFEEVNKLGFEGVALLGAIWSSKEKPHEVFRRALLESKKILKS